MCVNTGAHTHTWVCVLKHGGLGFGNSKERRDTSVLLRHLATKTGNPSFDPQKVRSGQTGRTHPKTHLGYLDRLAHGFLLLLLFGGGEPPWFPFQAAKHPGAPTPKTTGRAQARGPGGLNGHQRAQAVAEEGVGHSVHQTRGLTRRICGFFNLTLLWGGGNTPVKWWEFSF